MSSLSGVPITSPSLSSMLPWTQSPLIVGAPMRLISLPPLALAISRASGFGFIGAGTDLSTLSMHLAQTRESLSNRPIAQSDPSFLPVGVGILCHSASLSLFHDAMTEQQTSIRPPAAIWLFAPHHPEDLKAWVDVVRTSFPRNTPQIWIQVGSVVEAVASCVATTPDVLVIQGGDAGGHGLERSAGLMSLFPEVADTLQECHEEGKLPKIPYLVATGGVSDGRGAAAAITLGADAVCIGTNYLASHEAEIAEGYKREIVRASDGGQNTVRTRLYDSLRGTHGWPARFNGRSVINRSYEDSLAGVEHHENKSMYEQAIDHPQGWGPEGRLTTYAGTAVGLVREVRSAADITNEIRAACSERLHHVMPKL
ncbi:MAG: hypothetical protein M1828_000043 [Chrysothrix sp. TS-e1954]|nr:MAG: hypothetical protein M1828_000043 [Chrysothrix sp. TS-e1954]